jgi:hypothetical protein
MANIYKSEEGESPYKEHIEVTSVVQLEAIDRDAVAQMTDRLLAGAQGGQSKRAFSIDTDYDEARALLNITLAGSLPASSFLDYKYAADKRLFEESTKVSTIVLIDPIDSAFAGSITGYLLANAENHEKHVRNHPEHDVPLRIDSEYDEARQRLTLILNGSVFAIRYFCMIIYARFTQRLDRKARNAP